MPAAKIRVEARTVTSWVSFALWCVSSNVLGLQSEEKEDWGEEEDGCQGDEDGPARTVCWDRESD